MQSRPPPHPSFSISLSPSFSPSPSLLLSPSSQCHAPCLLQVHVNPSQSVLVLEGDDIESFNRAVQQVTYRNSLRFATPGVRPLKLTTSLR